MKGIPKPPGFQEAVFPKEAVRPPIKERSGLPKEADRTPMMMMGRLWQSEYPYAPREEPQPNGQGTRPGSTTPPPGREARDHSRERSREPNEQDTTVKIMLRLMEGMQAMQKQMLDAKDEESTNGAEVVRATQPLPGLPPWNPGSGPIDLNDWLALIDPHDERFINKQWSLVEATDD